MARLKTVGQAFLLAFASFLLAALVGRTPVTGSYSLAVLVSVILCPLALGGAGARPLGLGPWTTVAAVNALPVLSAVDDALRLGDPVQFRWIAASCLFSWAGWRLGSALFQRPDRDAA